MELEFNINTTTTVYNISDSDEEVTLGPSTSTPTTSRSHHRLVRPGTSVFIPHDIMKRPSLVTLATRMKMTPTQQAAFTEALIEETGGDVAKVSTSYATADKSRRKIGQHIATTCKDKWIPPKLATLHWDSKLLPCLTNQNTFEERLAVLLGSQTDMKLLGVPSYKPGTDRISGDIIAQLTNNLLESWNCQENVVNLTFDTTASNTGHISAACVTIQQRLNKALLWSGCRHHIGEVILTHIFTDLKVEASKSPDIFLFSRFRKNFEMFPHTFNEPLSRFDPSQLNEAATSLTSDWQNNVLRLCHTEQSLRRDDYLEFVDLCTVFLDGEVAEHQITFKRPGALHKARWMAKLLYSIKLCLFEKQIADLPAGTITTEKQVPKIREFVTFVTLVYSSWWMTCTSVTDAPWNDLQLISKLKQYEAVNAEISRSALKAFKRHLWYLTEEMVPLALFSSVVPHDHRRALADRLLEVQPDFPVTNPQGRFGTGLGKPRFPDDLTEKTTLADFVGPDSWYLFHHLKLDWAFLVTDVQEWTNSTAYQTSWTNVEALNVVNDSAERGVKLSSDFLSAARSEDHYQNVLQVVEHNRKEKPNLRKRAAQD